MPTDESESPDPAAATAEHRTPLGWSDAGPDPAIDPDAVRPTLSMEDRSKSYPLIPRRYVLTLM